MKPSEKATAASSEQQSERPTQVTQLLNSHQEIFKINNPDRQTILQLNKRLKEFQERFQTMIEQNEYLQT